MATNYPSGKDTFTTHVDSNNETVKAADINKIQDAVKAIEDELGTNPKGSKADVKTRIADVENITNAATSSATANSLIIRDANGRAKVSSPSASDDIARKDTIDAHANRTDNPHGLTTSQINAATSITKTATLPNTQGWYRIATSALNIAKNSGIFAIELNGSGVQNSIILSAGCNFGITNATTIQQLLYDAYTTNGITKARIVYHTTYTGNYAYLEVYLNGNTGGTITIRGIELKGWTLLNDPSTAGSIPSGYITKELAFNGGLATTEKVLASGKEAWHGGNSNIRTYVRATVNAQQDISPSVYTKLNFNTEITDNLNEFNATTSRFTAIEKGSYFIAFSLYLYYTNLNIEFKILAYKNGTLDKIICSTTTKGGDALISGSGEVELNAGDNLELYIYSSNNANPYSVKFTTDSNLDISRMS